MVLQNVLGSQKPPRKGCSRAILRRQRKQVKMKKKRKGVVRGSLGAPVARYSATKAPQVVEIPGLAC